MKRLRFFPIIASILLLGLSGCMTSGKVSMRERMLNAAWDHQEATRREKEAKKEKQKRARARIIGQFMNSWIGKPVSSYIRKVGPANQIAADGAGGRIYVWVEEIEMQRRVKKQPLSPRVSRKTKTQGTMRWNPLFQQWEFESETVPARTEPPDAAKLLLELHRQRRTETYTTHFRIMIYTRPDGTIYHCLID